MTNMEERYKTHTNEIVVNKQTEILRANKVIREVGRRLGSDWRYIFKYLMAGFPKEVIDIEYEKVERAKPFIQVSKPYICLRVLAINEGKKQLPFIFCPMFILHL